MLSPLLIKSSKHSHEKLITERDRHNSTISFLIDSEFMLCPYCFIDALELEKLIILKQK